MLSLVLEFRRYGGDETRLVVVAGEALKGL